MVVKVSGITGMHIAEVVQEKPLRLKVCEYGRYARLGAGDFIIMPSETYRVQHGEREEVSKWLRACNEQGYPFLSGLKCFGVQDGSVHEVLWFA